MKGKKVRKLLSIVMVCAMMSCQVVWAEEITDTDAEAVTETQEQTAGEATDVTLEKDEAETKEDVKVEASAEEAVPEGEAAPTEKEDAKQEIIEETVDGDLAVKETKVKAGESEVILIPTSNRIVDVKTKVDNPAIGTLAEVKLSADKKTIYTVFNGKINGNTKVSFTCTYDNGETDTFVEEVYVSDDEFSDIPEKIVATSTPRYDEIQCWSEEEMTAENTFIISSDSSICDMTDIRYSGDKAYGLITGKKAGTAEIHVVVCYREGDTTYSTSMSYRYIVKNVAEVSPVTDLLLHSYLLESFYNDPDRNGVISKEELKDMDSIYANGEYFFGDLSVKSLKGLEYAENLRELYLRGNKEISNIDQLFALPALRCVDLTGTSVSVEDRWKLAQIPDNYRLIKGESKPIEAVTGALGSDVDISITKGDGTTIEIVNDSREEWWNIKALKDGEAAVLINMGTKSYEIPVTVTGFDSDPEVGADSDADIEIADYLKGMLLDSNGNLWESYPELRKTDTDVVDYAANWVYSTGDDVISANGEHAASLMSYKLDKELSLWNGKEKLAENVLRYDGRYALTTDGKLVDIFSESPIDTEDVADWYTVRHSGMEDITETVETYIVKKDGTLWKREEVRSSEKVNPFVQIDESVTELFRYGYIKDGHPKCFESEDDYYKEIFESLNNIQEILSGEGGIFGYRDTNGTLNLLIDIGDWIWTSIGKQSEFGNIVASNKEYFWDDASEETHEIISLLNDAGELYCYDELTHTIEKCAENVVEFSLYKEYLVRTADGKYYSRTGSLIEITEDEPLCVDAFMEYEIYRTADGKQTLRRNGIEILSNVQKLLYGNEEDGKVYVLRTDGTIWDVSGVPVKATDLSESTYLRGDVNKDNKVTIKDLRVILHYLSGKEYLTEEQEVIADINGDGKVDIQDLRIALRYVCGKIDSL